LIEDGGEVVQETRFTIPTGETRLMRSKEDADYRYFPIRPTAAGHRGEVDQEIKQDAQLPGTRNAIRDLGAAYDAAILTTAASRTTGGYATFAEERGRKLPEMRSRVRQQVTGPSPLR
jgi:Asp-tRNA(Asn)/Glu-tRNA(Gln) amidotransferase B subunit